MGRIVSRIRGLALTLGAPGLVLVAFLDASFLPLPGITDVRLVVMVTRHPAGMLLLVAAAAVGSIAGCLVLHYLGRKGGEAFVRKRFTGDKTERAMATLRRHGVMAVLVPCLLPPPAPFKIFVLLAGAIGISASRLATAIAIGELHRELTQTLSAWGRSYEIIIVDDGSTDESFATLARLQAVDSHLRVIRFRRNFGQTAAFTAAFDHARGALIVTSDGDLQNDPRDIPAMVEKIERGFDIVCGWRKDRKDAFISRRLPSAIANRLISMATGVRLHDYGCSLKVFRAEVVKPLRLY